jgi:hypothetical protein
VDLREASGCGLVVVNPGREVVWEGLLRVVVVGTTDFLFLFIQKTFFCPKMIFYLVKGLTDAIKAGRRKCRGGEVLRGIGNVRGVKCW